MRFGIRAITALVGVAAFGCFAPGALAAPGDLDPTFSRDGKAQTGFPKSTVGCCAPAELALRTDGRTLVATSVRRRQRKDDDRDRAARPGRGKGGRDLAVARFTRKGKLDRSFSKDGRVVVRIPGSEFMAGIEAQPDGKTLIAASARNDMLLVRLTRKGRLDRSFSRDGRTTADFGLEDSAGDLELQPDGRILVAGTANRPPSSAEDPIDNDFAIARFTADGALDPSFGGGGKATIDLSAPEATTTESEDSAADLALRPDGRIVLGGTASTPAEYTSVPNFGVATLLPDGRPDPSFGGSRVVDNEGATGTAVAAPADGSVVMAGTSSGNFTLARFVAGGALDPSFAGDGTALLDGGGPDDLTDALAVQPDGKPVIAGSTRGTRDSADFALVRLTQAGVADESFSEDGKLTVGFGRDYDDADGIELQPDGRIVISGTVGERKVGISRHLVADGPPDFDADGVEDPIDNCPDQFGRPPGGCPKPSQGG